MDTRLDTPGLDQISTRWTLIHDPKVFIQRYAPAIRNYLGALIKNPHDAEEVAQDFFLKALRHGFSGANPDRGRFRDYLKIAVRNAAMTHLRRRPTPQAGAFEIARLSVPDEAARAADAEWVSDWRRCTLERAWQALDKYQRRFPGNLYHTVLRLAADHAGEDSKALAARVAQADGRDFSAEAYRKQLSRARHMFAELLVLEIRQTLEKPTPERIEEELIEVGLMEYVRDFLPADWRQSGMLVGLA